MQNIKPTTLILIILTLSLGGCGLTPKKNKANANSTNNANLTDNQIKAELLNTAKSIEQSLNTLANTQEANQVPLINTAALITAEGGMGGTADIDWTGPLAPLVLKLAKMTDYRMKILGNEPAIPIIITIHAKKAIIAEILQNAGLQAGKRAQLMISPKDRVIEIRYLSD